LSDRRAETPGSAFGHDPDLRPVSDRSAGTKMCLEGGQKCFEKISQIVVLKRLIVPADRPQSIIGVCTDHGTAAFYDDITPADNYENLFILWFRLDFRVFNFVMVKNFFNF
jgi:hypothetical protein